MLSDCRPMPAGCSPLGCAARRRAVLADDKRKPNVIVILADDLGWGDVGFNGRKEWATPNLDRVAKKGVKFNRWYTAAVVCARAGRRC